MLIWHRHNATRHQQGRSLGLAHPATAADTVLTSYTAPSDAVAPRMQDTEGHAAASFAAALVSRLALNGEDYGREREIGVRQRDIVRLTVMSRSAVASGVSSLASAKAIRIGDDNSERFTGLVHVPDVERLKDYALSEVREKEVRPLVRQNEG